MPTVLARPDLIKSQSINSTNAPHENDDNASTVVGLTYKASCTMHFGSFVSCTMSVLNSSLH